MGLLPAFMLLAIFVAILAPGFARFVAWVVIIGGLWIVSEVRRETHKADCAAGQICRRWGP